ncbi:MAG: hypothetical protein JWL69_3982 [Phycisphaerales bacterium]|nr:hypothetical protein [Phycisphaerales bacterium]MDB5356604.1 hypothetical protein [Phycisphaerales bacterium]
MNPAASSPGLSPTRLAVVAAVPFVLGMGVALAFYGASGASLGLFFGPMLLVSLVAPALALAEETVRARLVAGAGLTLGVWLVWLFTGTIGLIDALRCGLILAAWVLALAGFASLLRAAGLHAAFASTFTALLALAWLTWPVWLSHWLTGQSAPTWLTAPHPLLSLNGVLLDRFNAWDRRDLAYRELTVLNQDILYTMPASIWPMVAVHVALGMIGFTLARLRGRKLESRFATNEFR